MAITITAPYGTLANLPDATTRPVRSTAGTAPMVVITVRRDASPDSYNPITIVASAIEPSRPEIVTRVLVSGIPARQLAGAA